MKRYTREEIEKTAMNAEFFGPTIPEVIRQLLADLDAKEKESAEDKKSLRLLRIELEETLKYVPHVDDVVRLRSTLVKLGISPPESIETLGATWLSYVRKVLVAILGNYCEAEAI